MINNEIRDMAMDVMRANVGNLGVLAFGSTGRSISKPRNVVGVFARPRGGGARFQIHASRTNGRMVDMIWVYDSGVLVHEERAPEICAEVLALAGTSVGAEIK